MVNSQILMECYLVLGNVLSTVNSTRRFCREVEFNKQEQLLKMHIVKLFVCIQMYTVKFCVISKIILCSGVRKKNTEIWPQKTSGGTGGLSPRG